MSGVCCTPKRTHVFFGAQSSRLNCAYANFSRNVCEPFSELPLPVSRIASGVTRKRIQWFSFPVTLMYARLTLNDDAWIALPSLSSVRGEL